ncbi:hypothetical protein GCM10009827_116530 [Dactylosporangium maewongense]|uniref:Carbohydrate ABC transporter substrate-binding protein (CUT1 family) n=1 Tax=Dactylosporangium maewongense TaxID=634393 RepID=A0ABP4P7P4_9ACTN
MPHPTPAPRAVAALAAGLLALTGLSACNGSSKEDAEAGSTFTYWSMWKEGEPQQKVLQASIDAFTTQTGIKVEVQWAGRQVLQQVVPRLNSGNPPDLTDQDASALQSNLGAVNGALGLADLYASQITGESVKISDVIPTALTKNAQTSDGQPIVVPYEVIGTSMWFNGKNHPDLVGKPQLTWSEFVARLDALKSQGRTPIALDGDISGYVTYWLTWSIVRHGGVGLLNKACQDKTGATWNDPAILAAAKDTAQLVSGKYLPPDFNATKFPAQQTAWATGSSKTDFLLMGTWAPSETGEALKKSGKDANSVISYHSTPYPKVDGGKGNTAAEAGAIGFAIPAKARNAAAAKKFIQFFLNKDQISAIATQAENLTPRTDVPTPATLSDFAKEYAAANGNFFLTDDNCGVVAARWVTDVWTTTATDFFNGKIAGADALVAALKDKSVKFHANNG